LEYRGFCGNPTWWKRPIC